MNVLQARAALGTSARVLLQRRALVNSSIPAAVMRSLTSSSLLYAEPRDGVRSQVHFRLTPQRHALESQEHADQRMKERLSAPSVDGEPVWENPITHAVWSEEEVKAVEITHVEPKKLGDKFAFALASATRTMFDTVTGYKHEGRLSVDVWLRRIIFLETIAGVPGMVAGMLRHMRSLRRMQRDHGWIHTLLEEAENERMHLLTFLRLRDPGPLFRFVVLGAQGVFFNLFFLCYLVSPTSCHRFVGFVEEEAVKTYTRLIHDLENGLMPEWEDAEVPVLAMKYWQLPEDSKMVDLIYAIRADEANHRDVNHTFANLEADSTNPYILKHVVKKKQVAEPGKLDPTNPSHA